MININGEKAPLPIGPKRADLSESTQRRLKLKKATQQFEAIFVAQLLKNMRSVSFSKNEENGFGKDIMLSIADESVAESLSKSGKFGIGDLLYKHLTKRLDETQEAAHKFAMERPPTITEQSKSPGIIHLDTSKQIPVESANKLPASAELRTAIKSLNSNSTPAVPAETELQKTNPQGATPGKLERYLEEIHTAAAETNLPSSLLKAMIKHESNGDALAVSPKGAAGLMQLMPDTAKAMGVTDRFDPKENILGGARYLRALIDRFKDLKTALAAYNAGPSAIVRHGGIPPFGETIHYVEKIINEITDSK